MAGYGLSNAVRGFFDTQRAVADDKFRARVRQSQVNQLDDEDARIADVNAARQRGAEIMAQRQAEWERLQGGLMAPENPVPVGSPVPNAGAPVSAGLADAQPMRGVGAPTVEPGGMLAGSPVQAAAPQAAAPQARSKAFTPNPQDVLGAYDATTAELAKRGRWKDWAASWAKGAQIRGVLRGQALDQAEAQYRATGDPLALAQAADKYVEDGFELTGAQKVLGADGKPAYRMTRRNVQTGKDETRTVTAEQILDGFRFARDPQAVRKAEAETAMKLREALIKIQEEQAKQDAQGRREKDVDKNKYGLLTTLEGVKFGNEKEVTRLRGGIESGQISQRGAEARKTDAAKAKLPYSMPDGNDRWVDQRQPDGTMKPVRLIDGVKGGRRTTPSELSSMAQRLFTDSLTGRSLDASQMSKVTAAASMLTNSGMDANAALNKAASDLGYIK